MEKVTQFILENVGRTVHENHEDSGTLIGLPYPYTVPCADEQFLEMYYWDTYFTNLGLIGCGMKEQARNNVNNMLFLIEKYGFMPNGNRTYYLNRSQPPFSFAMVRDIYREFEDAEWLKNAYNILKIEYRFWQTRRAVKGLNYYGNPDAVTEENAGEWYQCFADRSQGFSTDDPQLKRTVAETFITFAESGWDCCSRFELDGLHYYPVDLNALLYGFEKQMAYFASVLDLGETDLWETRAYRRKELMKKHMWNPEQGIFTDYQFDRRHFSPVRSAASLYPLFVKMADVSEAEGGFRLLKELMLPYGVGAACPENCRYSLQWDYPNVWPPLQYIAYRACKNYGKDGEAREIAEKYTALIEKNFKETGNLWEKFDGNTGKIANQDYVAPTMLGWTAGVYLYFKREGLKPN